MTQMSFIQRIEQAFLLEEIRLKMDGMFKDLEGLEPAHQESIRNYTESKVLNVIQALKDVSPDGDDSEAQRLVPSLWLSWRLEWSIFNAQMQYQSMIQGAAQPELMARGAVLSYLIGILESFVDAETSYWLYKIAADPIPAVSEKAKYSTRLIDLTSSGNEDLK